MTIASSLSIREMRPADTPAVLELLRTVLGPGPTGERTPEFFSWKHMDNPFGRSPGLLAETDGRIVAVRMFLRWGLELNGQPVQALRAVDTATAPSHRGRGLFRDLTMELLRRLDDAGEVDLVFNTPNANSRPGYLKMGWSPVGTLPVRVSPARFLRFGLRAVATAVAADGSGPASVSREVAECPFEPAGAFLDRRGDDLQALLATCAQPRGLTTPRSLAFLTWRYGGAPGLDYRCLAVEDDRRLRGVAFGRLRPRGRMCEFTLSDVVVGAGDADAAHRLLSLARRAGADHVAIHATPASEISSVALRSGYLPLPRQGLGLVANPRRGLAVDPCLPESWRLTLGDLEVF